MDERLLPGSCDIQPGVLKRARLNAGLSQRALAKQAGVNKNVVHNAEKGGKIRYGSAHRLSEVLGLSVFRLVETTHSGEVSINDASNPSLDPCSPEFASVRIVSEELNGMSTEDEVNELLTEIMLLADAKRMELTKLREGSLHFQLTVCEAAAKTLEQLFEKNSVGELEVSRDLILAARNRLANDCEQFHHRRVSVIAEQSALRSSIELLLSGGFHVSVFASASEFLQAPGRADVNALILGDSEDILASTQLKEIRQRLTACPAVYISRKLDRESTLAAIDAGFSYAFESPFERSAVVKQLDFLCLQNQQRLQQSFQLSLKSSSTLATLSEREIQVLRLLAKGNLNKQIAIELGVGMRTVETYRSRVMAKIGAHSFADAVAFAISVGLRDAHTDDNMSLSPEDCEAQRDRSC